MYAIDLTLLSHSSARQYLFEWRAFSDFTLQCERLEEVQILKKH